MSTYHILLVMALLLFSSILLTPLSARLGMPVLLLFFGVGMLAGEDGPGGIQFSDFDTAFLVSNLALAIILLDGGMRTRARTFRVGLRPASLLATVGVMLTAAITGYAAAWWLGLPWLHGMLMGAIVASTDAAAVFSLLQGRSLNQRVSATLEIESGSNDPMAIFLVMLLLELIRLDGAASGLAGVRMLVEQFGIGIVAGVLGGWLLSQALRRLELVPGLYSLLAMSGGLLVFAATGAIGGSGFLAIYIVGLWLGNSRLACLSSILPVHDGLAWLAQMGLFLMLGLLVTPSQMVDYVVPALGIALVMVFLARPLAVWLCLRVFNIPWREVLFISWVGLRGAVPIVLALFPVMAGLPEARLLFDVTCVVVLVSLLLQGMTLAPMARWLKLEVPPPRLPQHRIPLSLPGHGDHVLYLLANHELLKPARTVPALRLPVDACLLAVSRGGEILPAHEVTELEDTDWLLVAGYGRTGNELGKLLAAEAPERLLPRQFFGEFVLSGDALVSDLASLYGFAVPADTGDATLADLFVQQHRHPVVGDKVPLGVVQLVAMAVQGDRVTRVGMKLPAS
ncbi:MAG: potassium/proton antiporter [Gammaproteobacteria bacterium]|nr:MAG: potassium/proton antiporter [Gammaproteobacteria bacterium]